MNGGARRAGGWRERRPARATLRVNLMFVLPFALVPAAFMQEPVGLALRLAAFALMLLAAWLTREGVRAEEAFDARRVARRPAVPRKGFAAAALAAGLALGVYVPGGGVAALAVGVLGAVLHLGAFGLDPMRDKHPEGVDGFQSDRVARAVAEAETHLAAMRAAIAGTGDRNLVERVDAFQDRARALFRSVEADPRRLTSARRYLGVYLLGACDAAKQYAALDRQARDGHAQARLIALLDDLERDFAARTEALLGDDRARLDIEIDVLRERLQREGLRPE